MKMSKIILCIMLSLLFTMQACYMNLDTSVNTEDDNGVFKNQIYGSGTIITINKNFRDFDMLEFNNLVKATIVRSDHYSVSIELNDNLVSYLETSQKGNKVSIGLAGNNNYKNVKFQVTIETPDITTLNLTGASAIDISGFALSHSLSVLSSGASSIIGSLSVKALNLELSGASYVNIEGSAKDLDIDGSGASSIKMFNFAVNNADVNLSGASVAAINVIDRLDVIVSGASVFQYKGNPVIGRMSISGGSVFQRVN